MDYAKTGYQKPLPEKALLIDRNIRQRHNLLGLYPSMVEVPLDGSATDHSTASVSDVNHAVCWTGYHLAGYAHYVAYLKRIGDADRLDDAIRRADEIFEGAYRCLLITGGQGLQARGYRTGHGPVYPDETDARNRTRDHWFQGTGAYRDLRWRGDPSHHNYSHSSLGYGAYWRLAATGKQKERCAHALSLSVGYWADRDCRLYRPDDGLSGYPMYNLSDGKTLTTSVLMMLGALKAAFAATGEDRFKTLYADLTERFFVRTGETLLLQRDFDDASQVMIHLENLLALEKDPELLQGYRRVMQQLWQMHRQDGQSLYHFIYAAHLAETDERPRIVSDGLQALFSWPVDMTIRPRMNSLDPQIKPPYPVYRAVFDNEYMWKGNLLQQDGWLSRIVRQVETSKEDPAVLYALDEQGDLYLSRDQAETPAGWKIVRHGLAGRLVKILQGRRTRIMLGMTQDAFYISESAMTDWYKLPVPQDGGLAQDLIYDEQQHTVYAVTSRNVYRSAAIDEAFTGQQFSCLTTRLPQMHTYRFSIGLAGEGRIYAICPEVKRYHPTPTLYSETPALLTSQLEKDTWQVHATFGFAYDLMPAYDWLLVDPFDASHIYMGVCGDRIRTRMQHLDPQAAAGDQPLSIISQSHDCGQTWKPTMHSIYEDYWHQGADVLEKITVPAQIYGRPVADHDTPGLLYAACDRGLLKSTDGGCTFTLLHHGLEIPRIMALSYDQKDKILYAGTPAGLFISKDGGRNFYEGNLTLQFIENTRREIGGAAYLDAYWRALHYGLINEAGELPDASPEIHLRGGDGP